MEKYRILTNNIWKCDASNDVWAAQGLDCSSPVRAKGLVKVYSELLPDVIGIQEASNLMNESIMKGLAEKGLKYAILWGRDTPVYYRQDKFELVDSDFFIYPEEVPGFEGSFNNQQTKSYCIAVFRSKADGKQFIFCTTHLWYMVDDPHVDNYQAGSGKAREYQLKLAMDAVQKFIDKYNCPAIIVGDLNESYYADGVQSALKNGYLHAHDIATDFASEEEGWHYCYARGVRPYVPGQFKDAIDHMLLKGFPEGTVKRFERYTPDYYYCISDHSPAYIDIEY